MRQRIGQDRQWISRDGNGLPCGTRSPPTYRLGSDGQLHCLRLTAQLSASKVSSMPTDLVNQLSNRQEFLDLVRYDRPQHPQFASIQNRVRKLRSDLER